MTAFQRKVLWKCLRPRIRIYYTANKPIQPMKTYNSVVYILGLACAGLIMSACETTGPGAASAPPPNSGRVLIYRVANFGTDLSMVVSFDGKDVGSFTEGNNYSGYLPAGQHHLT